MKRFTKSLNGYNVSEVNEFVNDVISKVDDMINKMKEKDREIVSLNKELEHYKNMEDTLNRAVVMAEMSANKFQESSINESDLIVREAKKNANRIINDALMKAESIEKESQRLRRNIVTYKRRLRALVEEQLNVIDDIDKIDIE